MDSFAAKRKRASATGSAEELVSSFVSDTVMILAVALIIFLPFARNRVALLERQAQNGSSSSSTLEPLRLDVIRGAVFSDGRPASTIDRKEVAKFRGRSATVRVRGDAISAETMGELARLYHELGLASWSFQFTQEVSR